MASAAFQGTCAACGATGNRTKQPCGVCAKAIVGGRARGDRGHEDQWITRETPDRSFGACDYEGSPSDADLV